MTVLAAEGNAQNEAHKAPSFTGTQLRPPSEPTTADHSTGAFQGCRPCFSSLRTRMTKNFIQFSRSFPHSGKLCEDGEKLPHLRQSFAQLRQRLHKISVRFSQTSLRFGKVFSRFVKNYEIFSGFLKFSATFGRFSQVSSAKHHNRHMGTNGCGASGVRSVFTHARLSKYRCFFSTASTTL